jgi:cyclophilin family peptidyl-prolyl cis-trans isomerase
MAVRERDIVKDLPDGGEALPGTLLDRINAFGERHAKVIIIASTGLVIVTVLIFAQVLWTRSLPDRLERDLAKATTVEDLEALRTKYAGTVGEPRVLATLGHKYALEGKLEEALRAYDEFLAKYREHVLAAPVNRSRNIVVENLEFRKSQQDGMARQVWLDVHPLLTHTIEKHPFRTEPVKEKNPVLGLKFKGKPAVIRVELFEDEAPLAVASLVSLAEKKYFDGLTFAKAGEDRIQIHAKKDGADTSELPFETTFRPGDPGLVVLMRRGAGNAAAEFQILLKPANVKDMTAVGKVISEGDVATILSALGEKDEIESLKVESKRGHEYAPTPGK